MRTSELAQDVEAVAAEARGSIAVLFAGNGLDFLMGDRAHAQAQGVGQADEGHEFAQLLVAA